MIRMCALFLCMFVAFPCFAQTQADADAARSSAGASKATSDGKHSVLVNKIASVQTEINAASYQRTLAWQHLTVECNKTTEEAYELCADADMMNYSAEVSKSTDDEHRVNSGGYRGGATSDTSNSDFWYFLSAWGVSIGYANTAKLNWEASIDECDLGISHADTAWSCAHNAKDLYYALRAY